MLHEVTVFAPATVANVACAFDVLGFAIAAPGDEVAIRRADSPGIKIKTISGDGGVLPYAPEKNTAGVSVKAFLEHLKIKDGVEIELHKGLPIGSGLGSSSASTVAAVVAVNELFGRPLSRSELVPFAMLGEKAACGAAHADNVAPAILGGFVLIRSYEPLDVIALGAPDNLYCTVVSPQVEVKTEDARKILKRQIPFKDAIVQWGNVGGLIAGILRSDSDLISRSLRDVIVEPERAVLIPAFEKVKNAALQNGALGCSISGSGPALFALSKSAGEAEQIARAMKIAFGESGIGSCSYSSKINKEGATVKNAS